MKKKISSYLIAILVCGIAIAASPIGSATTESPPATISTHYVKSISDTNVSVTTTIPSFDTKKAIGEVVNTMASAVPALTASATTDSSLLRLTTDRQDRDRQPARPRENTAANSELLFHRRI